MILTKSVLLTFLFICQYCCGSNECTLADIIFHQFKKGAYGFFDGQKLTKTNQLPVNNEYYSVTTLAYYKNCLGFITETLETVILECPEYQEKTGCFQILTPKYISQNNTIVFAEKDERVCATKVDDTCIGIKIQEEIIVTLKCYFDFNTPYTTPIYRYME